MRHAGRGGRRVPPRVAAALAGALAGLALLAVLAGCGRPAPARSPEQLSTAPSASERSPGPGAGGVPGPAGSGVAAEPVASSWPVRAEGLRLVRSGSAELALQFELVNRTSDTYSGEDLGLGPVEQLVMLADLPRGTGYAPLTARYSTSAADQIPVGGSTTVTVVFPAPPAETTSMLFVMNGLLPVRVPVQPPGAAALREDPVLHAAATPEEFPKVAPLICGSGPGAGSAAVPTRYRLPGDVLFAFGSAQLTPAAATSIDALAARLTAKSGSVLVEGHTDAVGDDPANQTLSEQRAASVRDALAAKLGTGFSYRTAGFGETRPIAPNTRPDGDGDNPDGRAQNRRVELTIETAAGDLAAARQEPPATTPELAGLGLAPKVLDVTTGSGYALARVELHNTTAREIALPYINDANLDNPITPGELRMTDTSGALASPCEFEPPTYFDVLANAHAEQLRYHLDAVPPGATLTMWALFVAPPASSPTVTVGIGGCAAKFPAPVTEG
ncbi:MAG: OmpA/MotB domain protein [Pseudonocardia sp.]|nr:OmpA/MotB domain protein [Pseudonocardia sp.]